MLIWLTPMPVALLEFQEWPYLENACRFQQPLLAALKEMPSVLYSGLPASTRSRQYSAAGLASIRPYERPWPAGRWMSAVTCSVCAFALSGSSETQLGAGVPVGAVPRTAPNSKPTSPACRPRCKTVRLWNIDLRRSAAAIGKVCATVDRNLTRRERATYLPGRPSSRVCPA